MKGKKGRGVEKRARKNVRNIERGTGLDKLW